MGQISALVPQVFYDIIGRIIPGFLLLIVALLLLMPDSWQIESGGILFDGTFVSYGLLFWVGLLFSYLIGVSLGAFGYLVDGKEWREELDRDVQGRLLRRMVALLCRIPVIEGRTPAPECYPVKVPRPQSALSASPREKESEHNVCIYDVVSLLAPATGANLVKLSAERNMCRVLIGGFGLLIPTYIVVNVRAKESLNWAVVALLTVGIVSSAVFHRHIRIRSQYLMANLGWFFVKQGRVKLSETGDVEAVDK